MFPCCLSVDIVGMWKVDLVEAQALHINHCKGLHGIHQFLLQIQPNTDHLPQFRVTVEQNKAKRQGVALDKTVRWAYLHTHIRLGHTQAAVNFSQRLTGFKCPLLIYLRVDSS